MPIDKVNIRNIAIIAHVDHGKTTLVDGLLKQSKTFRDNEKEMKQDFIMDTNPQERERGITILAKNTAIKYKGVKINIIDTPGHADFGGEVERTLNMADGAILVIDAQEGPMPQTKFVLKKALELGLKIIVVINKIDKKNAQVPETINRTADLFLDLATDEAQLEYPVFYSIAKLGRAWEKIPDNMDLDGNLSCIFEAILKYVPEPKANLAGDFQMMVSSLDWDDFRGKYAIGKINRGMAKPGLAISLVNNYGIKETEKIDKVFVSEGLKRVEVGEAQAGDIATITGIKNAGIGDTIADKNNPEALSGIKIEEPTLSIAISANTSPFAGREGQFVTARNILERINKELQTNVSMRLEIKDNNQYVLFGRGELHLSVFVETMRREGYELQIGKPEVVRKKIDGVWCEPVEELSVEVPNEYANNAIAEVIKRKGMMKNQNQFNDGTTHLVFEISTRTLLGLRNELLTLTRGTVITNSLFLRFAPCDNEIPKLRAGALVASETGKAVTYGLNNAQGRGITFIEPQTQVYQGMVVGLNKKENDLDVNVCKEKKLTNIRSSNSDISVILTPPTILSLEQSLEFLEDDELLEVTPKSLRLRKKIIDPTKRYREKNRDSK